MMANKSIAPSELIRDEVRALSAYHVPNPGDAIKLDAMENPFAWPQALPGDLAQQWAAGLVDVAVNRYPDPAATALRSALAEWMGLPQLPNADSLDLLLGNGSDELIQLLAMAVKHPLGHAKPCILAPEPGFVMYSMIARFVDADYVGVPLTQDFALDVPAMLAAIQAKQPALIFLAYPNNPTGNLWDKAALQTIVEAAPGLVVIDEAYTAFAADSCVDWLAEYQHVLVMRTLSKVGLAGLRLGVLAGDKCWLDEINKLRLPYNINSLTQYSASFALQNIAPLNAQAQLLKTQRANLYQQLTALDAVRAWPSEANFILFRLLKNDAVKVHQSLAEQGVLIKKLHGAHSQLEQCLRVTVGTEAENSRFMSALKRALK